MKGGLAMNKKYCIFDMDGTIADSMGYWKQLEREFLSEKGIKEDVDETLKEIQHMTIPAAMEFFIDRFGFTGTVESLTEEFNGLMAEHYRNDIDCKPGAKEYLDKLHSRGVKMCIASATSTPLVKIALNRMGISDYFEFTLSCVEVGSSKDKPDVFLEAARRLGSTPEDTAVFEDSLVATVSAKSAGFYTVGIYDKYSVHNWPAICELADELIEDWQSV